jgi:hypothetical protein
VFVPLEATVSAYAPIELPEAAVTPTTSGLFPVEAMGLTQASSVTPLLVLRPATLLTVMWFWLDGPRRTAVLLGSETNAPGTPNVTDDL